MTKKLYRHMNWPKIEGILYSDTDQPGELLGPHTEGTQTLIQAYLPGAEKVSVLTGKPLKEYPMELADESGYFAALLPIKKMGEYKLKIAGGKNEAVEIRDPYAYPPEECELSGAEDGEAFADPQQILLFHAGRQYEAWKYMGAHRASCRGAEGVLFRVWAPEASRVSVIGAFNRYDGRMHQMNRNPITDLFELFIPGFSGEEYYQYEIRERSGELVFKADPYAASFADQGGHYLLSRALPCAGAAAVWNAPAKNDRIGQGGRTPEKRAHGKHIPEEGKPLQIRELSLDELLGGSVSKRKQETVLDDKAKALAGAGYTHVEIQDAMLMNAENHSVHETIGFYAVNPAADKIGGIAKIVGRLHEQGLKVILEWAPGCFSKAPELLGDYDGTCLYEHLDRRQGFHGAYQVKLFNYRRPEVKSFLLSSLNYLITELGADGIRICDTSFMLYLDYGKNAGEWLPNMYGGNENTDAIEFLKEAVAAVKKLHPDVLMIADEASGWANLTSPREEGGFGFDYKWNYAMVNDLLRYLTVPYYDRRRVHHELTMSYLYMYAERFINALSEDYILKSDCGLACMNTENETLKSAAARLLPAYLILHPGAKLLNESFLPEDQAEYRKALCAFYKANPALYENDGKEEGFEWINSISANESVLLFLRRAGMQTLLVGINFSDQTWMSHKSGVPYDGKYKEIFNTDDLSFGGTGCVNARVIKAKKDECDTREYSIRFNLAPMSAAVFEYVPYTKEELAHMQEKEQERLRKKEEDRRRREQLKKKKEKIRASLKEELARKIAKAEAQIASGSEYKGRGRKS